MKKFTLTIFMLLMVLTVLSANGKKEIPSYSLTWKSEPVQYKHFTDMGNYLLMQNVDYKDCEKALELIRNDKKAVPSNCTATAKLNKKGEVIFGRNMDIEISQNPAIISFIKGGKYNTVSFSYSGVNGQYKYSQLKELDEDDSYRLKVTFISSDAFNEKGLYAEVNMREMDSELDIYCPGINPGKPRASLASAPTLIAANCATVPEALEFLRNSYDWYSLGFFDTLSDGAPVTWNLAMMIGDAQGNFGLVEFAFNKIYYTPYANGQGNYYINPQIAEYANYGSGYGRLAAGLENLSACETEEDMLHNMENAMWRREILEPGSLGYSDSVFGLNERRSISQKDLQKKMEEEMAPHQAAAREFYSGNEKPLRDDGTIWTTGFNFGVNCAKKHLYLRLWENDNAIFECQWK